MLMKTTAFIVGAFCAFISTATFAQEKVREVVTSDYNRNSISLVSLQRGDGWDNTAAAIVRDFDPGAKFDANDISTKSLRLSKTRSEAATQEEVNYAVDKVPFAREILAFIFDRDSKGMMNDKLVRYRGNYDAKDQDIINARASRVGTEALGDLGHGLVAGSYIMVVDFYDIRSERDKKGNVTWYADAQAFAYRIGITPAELDDFYEHCWIYEDDEPAAREDKIRAFNTLNIGMVPEARSSSSGSGKTAEAAMSSAINGLVTGLENRIDSWEVAVTIAARRPLRAKIGTKEGLRNGARYRAYSYKEDRNGNLLSVPRGFLRATEIADNTGMASGETETSKFYQISGLANIDEGWTIKQSNDMGIGVALGVKIGGLCSTSFMVDLDYLMNVRTGGSMSYLLLNGGFDLKNTGVTNFQVGVGYAYGLHLTRFFELAPYLLLSVDYLSRSVSSYESEYTALQKSAVVFEPGLRAALNVAYPLQVYGKLGYDWLTLQGSQYQTLNTYANHKSGVAFQVGAKWTF